MKYLLFTISFLLTITTAIGQHHMEGMNQQSQELPDNNIQPVFSGFKALFSALQSNGMFISKNDSTEITNLMHQVPGTVNIARMESLFDKYALLSVTINPEARISVKDGIAAKVLTQNQWTAFLVKVANHAGLTSPLSVNSESAGKPYHDPRSVHYGIDKNITKAESQGRFLQIQLMNQKPLLDHLSGAAIEYQLLNIYATASGIKEVQFAVDAGKGTSDLAFRNTTRMRFNILPSVNIKLRIRDDQNKPGMAAITVRALGNTDNRLSAYYPLPAARLAAYDEYPDFFFQPQVYRKDGEYLRLAPGRYVIGFSNGPESVLQHDTLNVPTAADSMELMLKIKYWIRLSPLHYFSSDSHVHGAGCAHYDNPEQGVDPIAMWRQQAGEDLNISANLAWQPGWYHQKMFFTGKDETYSTAKNILHNDVEVSGFPSSHCGHLVLLGLKEDDYPGTDKVEQWPSWTGPVLQWAKNQGAVVGYAHSGWGLEPIRPTSQILNFETPKMDGVGANEFVASVTQHLVDFYSLGDTPPAWELNMLYHTWNCGFKTKLSGETDFPCLTDNRVGQGRSYFKTASGRLSYAGWLKAIKDGTLYVSDGRSHILNFQVNGTEHDIAVNNTSKVQVKITAQVAALLSVHQTDDEQRIYSSPADKTPFWSLDRARVGQTRKVKVECIMNGKCVDSTYVEGDGKLHNVSFSADIGQSSWVALRIFPSSHTNAIFVELDQKPVLEKRSAQWCIDALKKCWEQKSPAIRPEEQKDASAFYLKAQSVYEALLSESK